MIDIFKVITIDDAIYLLILYIRSIKKKKKKLPIANFNISNNLGNDLLQK